MLRGVSSTASSGSASTITVADAAGDTTTFVVLVGGATGAQAPLTDSGITYSATTDVLNTTASGVVVADAAGDTTTWIMLSGGQTGSQAVLSDTSLTYNATANALVVGGSIGIGAVPSGNHVLDVRSLSGQTAYIRLATNDFAAGSTGTALEGFFGAATGNSTVTLQATNTGGTVYGAFNIDCTTINLRPGGVTAISATSSTAINMTASGATLTVGVGADNGTVSAGIFTDRTKYFEGDALAELTAIQSVDGHIDHATLPAFARAQVKKDVMGDVEKTVDIMADVEKTVNGETIVVNEKVGEETVIVSEKVGEETVVERDLGAMISLLTVAVKQLTAMNNTLATRIAALEP